MHPNPIFRKAPAARNIAFAREQGFGILALSGGEAPLLSHIPFVLSQDGGAARFHLTRSNPIARALADGPLPATLAVQGPHSYVSPDWYGIDEQVPTWNYVAVHMTGPVQRLPDAALRDLLDSQSAHYEARLAPKTPWTADKMDPGTLARMMRQIAPCEMRIDTVDGTWKFSQNKPDAARLAAAGHVEGSGSGQEVRLLAAMMRTGGNDT